MRREEFRACALCLARGDFEPDGSDAGELRGLEEVYIAILKRLDHIRREVGQPHVVIYKAGEGDVRGRFTVEDVLQSCYYPEQVFTLPLAGAATSSISGGIALSVPGGPEQAHQLFLFLRDEVR